MANAFKHKPGCQCCNASCTATICATVKGCNSGLLSGATVTVKHGATTVGTCTTDGTGSCCVAIPDPADTAANAYQVTASKTGFTTSSAANATVTCGGTTNVGPITLAAAAGYTCTGSCCPPDPNPTTLTLTDPYGSVTLSLVAGQMTGCHTPSVMGRSDQCVGFGVTPCQTAATVACPIIFVFTCSRPLGGGVTYTLSVNYAACYDPTTTPITDWPSGKAAPNPPCTAPATCSAPGDWLSTGGFSMTQNPGSCPLSPTFTIPTLGDNGHTQEIYPGGGTITVTV